MNFWALLATHVKHIRNTRLSTEGIKAQRLKKLRRLIAHVNRNSPYYRDIILSCGINVKTCVPEDFPIMRKSLLMGNFDNIFTDRRITREDIATFLETSKKPSDLVFSLKC